MVELWGSLQVEVDNKLYETIPHHLIIQAALVAASGLLH
jgi:hypothetical protein